MKLYKLAFVLVVALTSVSVFAANRKPAAGVGACGTKIRAIHNAVVQSKEDGHTACKESAAATDGPDGGILFTYYHVTLACEEGSFNYDSESHFVGLPGKLVCTPTVNEAGQFEAH